MVDGLRVCHISARDKKVFGLLRGLKTRDLVVLLSIGISPLFASSHDRGQGFETREMLDV